MNKPKVAVLIELIRVCILFIGCFLFIPQFGSFVPAVIMLVLDTAGVFALALYLYNNTKVPMSSDVL